MEPEGLVQSKEENKYLIEEDDSQGSSEMSDGTDFEK